jgi:hypothetical protein
VDGVDRVIREGPDRNGGQYLDAAEEVVDLMERAVQMSSLEMIEIMWLMEEETVITSGNFVNLFWKKQNG